MPYSVNSDIWNQIINPLYRENLDWLEQTDRGFSGYKKLKKGILTGEHNPFIGMGLAQNANTRDMAEYANRDPDTPAPVRSAQVRGDFMAGAQKTASDVVNASTQGLLTAMGAIAGIRDARTARGLDLREKGMSLAAETTKLVPKKTWWDYLREGVGMASSIAGMFVPGAGMAGQMVGKYARAGIGAAQQGLAQTSAPGAAGVGSMDYTNVGY